MVKASRTSGYRSKPFQGKSSAQKLLAQIARLLPTTPEAAFAENAEDARAELFEKIDLVAKRMAKTRTPGEE